MYECTYGGYYGLVVVTPPCPQTFHCSHDNLKNPYFTCTYIDMGERITGKQDRPNLIRAPQITKNKQFVNILAHIMKN